MPDDAGVTNQFALARIETIDVNPPNNYRIMHDKILVQEPTSAWDERTPFDLAVSGARYITSAAQDLRAYPEGEQQLVRANYHGDNIQTSAQMLFDCKIKDASLKDHPVLKDVYRVLSGAFRSEVFRITDDHKTIKLYPDRERIFAFLELVKNNTKPIEIKKDISPTPAEKALDYDPFA